MEGWKRFCEKIGTGKIDVTELKRIAGKDFREYGVYRDSICYTEGSYLFIASTGSGKMLVIYGKSAIYGDFKGKEADIGGAGVKICELSNKNCSVLQKHFAYTNPVNHKGFPMTIGLGDRLGLASPGHIRLIRDLPVFPVLAQQSIRELNLTGRTYTDVLSAASWAVFQEGYRSGFGADGDHLKTPEEVKMAIDCGFTMITLDCSEHIDNSITSLTAAEIDERYSKLPVQETERLERKYLKRKFKLESDSEINFTSEEFKKTVLIYLKAIRFTIDIFNSIIKQCGRPIDFEMSIDETSTPTAPESHFFVASELINGGVEITSLAPRFCGEFQKGIDYRGDINRFTGEFSMHVRIAGYFGYKISVHSGSDKFSVFPVIGEKTAGKYHLKTAGTNWLEAVRVIAAQNPSLYREMHRFALSNLDEARKYYHISADPAKVPDVEKLKDFELPSLMDMDDSRQILHITYGLILTAKKPDGSPLFKDRIYSTLNMHEGEYYAALETHIGKHLSKLSVKKQTT